MLVHLSLVAGMDHCGSIELLDDRRPRDHSPQRRRRRSTIGQGRKPADSLNHTCRCPISATLISPLPCGKACRRLGADAQHRQTHIDQLDKILGRGVPIGTGMTFLVKLLLESVQMY